MELSNKVLNILTDIVSDPEFQFDYKLGDNIKSNVEFLVHNKDVLKPVITSLINDYKLDIEMEKKLNEDYTYLTVTLNELENILIRLEI